MNVFFSFAFSKTKMQQGYQDFITVLPKDELIQYWSIFALFAAIIYSLCQVRFL
jgi:hypothetical protein